MKNRVIAILVGVVGEEFITGIIEGSIPEYQCKCIDDPTTELRNQEDVEMRYNNIKNYFEMVHIGIDMGVHNRKFYLGE